VEQRRRVGAAAVRGERDLGAQQLAACAPELVRRGRVRRAQEPESLVERAGLQAGLRGGERTLRLPGGLPRQRDRTLQERRRRGETAAGLRPARRALELQGDALVRLRRGGGQMPRPAVRVGLPVGGLGQRLVGRPKLGRARGAIDGRADQRVTKGHPLRERQEPVGLDVHRRHGDAEPVGGPEQQEGIAGRVGGGDEQQAPRVAGHRLEPCDVALLDPSRERLRLEQPESAGQLRRGQPARELEQGQRVAARLGDDPVAHRRVKHESRRGVQELARLVGLEPPHFELRQVLERPDRLARREDDPDRLGQQAPRDERQRERRCLIQPLGVVDHAQQRASLAGVREDAQRGQPDEEPVRGRAIGEAEHDLERPPLRSRDPVQTIQERCAELVEAREAELHLRLDAGRPDDGEVRRRLNQVLQQRRLPDAGLAAQHQSAALAPPDVPDQPVQRAALAGATEKVSAPPRAGTCVVHGRQRC
jgi:hypothetical protein